jgi:hypothetical protein
MTTATRRKTTEDSPMPLITDDAPAAVAPDGDGAPEPQRTPEAEAANRIWALYGTLFVDALRSQLAQKDGAIRPSSTDPTPKLARWLADWTASRRARHVLAAQLSYLERRAQGIDEPFVVNEEAITEATAADLLKLYALSSTPSPVETLTFAGRRKIAKASSELAEVRAGMTNDEGACQMAGGSFTGEWTRLTERLGKVQDLTRKLDRWRGALERLPALLAEHVGTAIDDVGGDDVIFIAYDKVTAPPPPPPIETDAKIVRLTGELEAARARVAAWREASSTEGRVDQLAATLVTPLEEELEARRAKLLAARAATRGAINQCIVEIQNARAGDAVAFYRLLTVATEHAAAFPAGFATRLRSAAGTALAAAGAVEFRDFLEPEPVTQ